jgi:hypothetical protein
MWFSNWSELLRIVLVGTAAYLTLVMVLRTSGKRTLAKLNAFDLVVTVALGSTLATIFLDKDISWAEGAVALGVLALLQFGVAEVTTRAGGPLCRHGHPYPPGARRAPPRGPAAAAADDLGRGPSGGPLLRGG